MFSLFVIYIYNIMHIFYIKHVYCMHTILRAQTVQLLGSTNMAPKRLNIA